MCKKNKHTGDFLLRTTCSDPKFTEVFTVRDMKTIGSLERLLFIFSRIKKDEDQGIEMTVVRLS